MSGYRISEVAARLDLTADTLRYYEKVGLLPRIARNDAGVRIFDNRDISRIRFIRRAQTMNFSLAEIGQLLEMRDSPQTARDDVRELTHRKLAEIENSVAELATLRNELQLLVNLCQSADDGCPILEELGEKTRSSS